MKFKRAFGSELGNISDLSTETHYNKRTTTYYHHLKQCPGDRVVLGASLRKPSDGDILRFESRYDHIIF